MSAEPRDDPVLIAYDGSECAAAAIQEAARQLAPGRRAIVVTIWEPLESLPFVSVAGTTFDQAAVESVISETEAGAREAAAEGTKLARAAGFEASPTVATGTPVWRRIIEVAAEQNASLIVVGSRGRSALGQVLLGSVASAVAHHSEGSVLIVHRRA